jgi:hypothetical protein
VTGAHVRHVHASGKSSHPAATEANLAAALTYFVTDPHVMADVITLTEMGRSHAALVRWTEKSGFNLHHPLGFGRSECAIISRQPLTHKRADRLTPLRLRSARSAPLYAATAKVQDGPWFSVTHTPAHNGGLDPTGKTAWPTRVYTSLASGWRVVRMKMRGGGVVLAADWNLDLRRAKIRRRLARPYRRMKWGWHPSQGSTEGGRVIDGVLTNVPIVSHSTTLPAQPGFDHNPVLTVLAPKRPRSAQPG